VAPCPWAQRPGYPHTATGLPLRMYLTGCKYSVLFGLNQGLSQSSTGRSLGYYFPRKPIGQQGSADRAVFRRTSIRYCTYTGYCPHTAPYIQDTYLPIFKFKIFKNITNMCGIPKGYWRYTGNPLKGQNTRMTPSRHLHGFASSTLTCRHICKRRRRCLLPAQPPHRRR
jgi:hypothetical protein